MLLHTCCNWGVGTILEVIEFGGYWEHIGVGGVLGIISLFAGYIVLFAMLFWFACRWFELSLSLNSRPNN
jgi:hypothetical protein